MYSASMAIALLSQLSGCFSSEEEKPQTHVAQSCPMTKINNALSHWQSEALDQ